MECCRPSAVRCLFLLMAVACLGLQGCGDDIEPIRATPPLPDMLRPQGDEFIVAYLPDTQIYAERFPTTMEAQTRWIAEYADEYNIVFVSHVGDVVQTGDSDYQWSNAVAAYAWLDYIDMPYGISFASHDETRGSQRLCDDFEQPQCRAAKYLQHFGPQKFQGKEWFGGASPSGVANFQTVRAGDMNLLFMHLPQDPPGSEIKWASEVLDRHPGHLAHLTTHRHLYDYRLTSDLPFPLNSIPGGRFNSLLYFLGGQGLKYQASWDAETVFSDFVARHPNIWSVHCGHVDAEFNQSELNDAGLPVYENLVDYQNMADGGGGWMRLLKYRPSLNEVQAITFSATSGAIRMTGDGFQHSIEIVDEYRQLYSADLAQLGITQADLDAIINPIKTPGPAQDAYYDSLYQGGNRESFYTMSVDFQAYINASN